jgi:hypothetical protein
MQRAENCTQEAVITHTEHNEYSRRETWRGEGREVDERVVGREAVIVEG